MGWQAGLELGYFAVSHSGSLVFAPGKADLQRNPLLRVHRTRAVEPIAESGFSYLPAVSPEGTRLAVISDSSLFLHDLERQAVSFGLSTELLCPGRVKKIVLSLLLS